MKILMDNNKNRENGFTLVELLIVILIIGILSAIAIPAFLNQRKAAAESSVKSDLTNAAKVFETELISKRVYPSTIPTTVTQSDGVSLAISGAAATTDLTAPLDTATDTPIKIRFKSTGAEATIYGRISGDSFRISNVAPEADASYSYLYSYTKTCSGTSSNSGVNGLSVSPGTGWGTSGSTAVCPSATPILESLTLNPVNHSSTTADIITATTISRATTANSAGFCIEGKHAGEPSNIWKYDSINGGLKKGTC